MGKRVTLFINGTSDINHMVVTIHVSALALFPSKTVDKKAAFVLGLSLFFKVPFDIVKALVISHGIDFSTGFSLFTQSLLCLALFHYYGLLGAWVSKK